MDCHHKITDGRKQNINHQLGRLLPTTGPETRHAWWVQWSPQAMLVPRSFTNVYYNEIGRMGCLKKAPAQSSIWGSFGAPYDFLRLRLARLWGHNCCTLLYWVLSTRYGYILVAIKTAWRCQGCLNIDSQSWPGSKHSPDRMEHIK